jgi:hypothetical protein
MANWLFKAMNQQFIWILIVLGVVKFEFTVLFFELKAPPVLQNRFLPIFVLIGHDNLSKEKMLICIGGVEFFDNDEAAFVLSLHLCHFGLDKLIFVLSDVLPKDFGPINCNRLLSELTQLDLRCCVQHEFYFEVRADQKHIFEAGEGLFDDLENEQLLLLDVSLLDGDLATGVFVL